MIETARLAHRKLTPEDLPRLIEMRCDPEVSRYLGGPRLQNPEALARRLEFYLDCYERCGFGTCAIIWKETGEMIGTSGIQPLEDTGEIEVGYSLIKEFWGRGLGYETARGWLDFGFGECRLDRLVAVAQAENAGSRRIMEKLGMMYEKTEVHYGLPCVFYAISAAAYRERRTL